MMVWKPDFTTSDPWAGMPEDYLGKTTFVPTLDNPAPPWESLSKTLIGRVTSPTPASLSECQEWDNAFRQGERGIFQIDFKVFPNFTKGWLCSQVDGILESRGIETWSPTAFISNTLVIYFVTGIGPIIIAAIVVGALVLIAVTIYSITLYSLKKIETIARTERQGEVLDTFLETLEGLSPEEAAERLAEWMEAENKAAEQSEKSLMETMFGGGGTVGLTLIVGVAVVLVILIVLSGRS